MNISAPFIRTADRHDAADHRHCAGGSGRLPAAAGIAAAAGGFPDHLRGRRFARRESRDHGLLGRDAARAPVRPHRRRHGDDVLELVSAPPVSHCSST